MVNKFKAEQDAFWAGEFGTNYIKRNQGNLLLASNLNFLYSPCPQRGALRGAYAKDWR